MANKLLLALCWLLAFSSFAHAQDDPLVRVVFNEPTTVYVGQRVSFSIEVLTTGQLDSAVQFDLGNAPGALLLRVPGSPTFGSDKLGGVSYTSYRYDFALYPHRAGAHTVLAVPVRGETVEAFGKPSVPFRIATESFVIDAVLPPGAEKLSSLVSAPTFTVEEHWEPAPGAAIVGDAFRQTITMRANDVLGMALPELSAPEIDGLRVYPRRPVVNDTIERGEITGEVTQTFVYICESPGVYTTPQRTITWFDLTTKKLRQETLASAHFEVEPDPEAALLQDAISTGTTFGQAQDSPFLIGLLVLLPLSLLVAWSLRKPMIAKLADRRARAATSIAHVRNACRENDAAAALAALLRHLDAAAAPGIVTTATVWSRAFNSPRLESAVANLERAFVAGDAWKGSELSAALPKGAPHEHHSDVDLDALNPTAQTN